MQLSTEHILTTHAGSLPRPDDLARMLYDLLDDKPVDQAALDARVRKAIADVVARQQKIGIDVISDGELGKVGFSNYVLQRMSGFEGKPISWPPTLRTHPASPRMHSAAKAHSTCACRC